MNSIAVFQKNLRLQLQAYLSSCAKGYEEIRHSSTIIYDPTYFNFLTNPLNIDCILTRNNPQDAKSHSISTIVSAELVLRGLSRSSSLEDCWQ